MRMSVGKGQDTKKGPMEGGRQRFDKVLENTCDLKDRNETEQYKSLGSAERWGEEPGAGKEQN